jgi:curli biogenesis system outer membrane secretion channel CsgG
MRRIVQFGALVLVMAVAMLTAAGRAQATRPTVALLDFDYGSINHWWSGNADLGKGIADLIVDGLVEDGSYRVIERKRLDAILAEQNFNDSDRVDPSAKAAKIGKALGVKYLIVGSITKFGAEDSKKSFGGGGFGSKFGVGKIGKSSGKATVGITARMIDSSTGEIMASAKGEGESKRSGLLLGGAGGGSKYATGELDMSSSNFQDTIIGEATEIAVKQVVDKLIAAKTRLE